MDEQQLQSYSPRQYAMNYGVVLGVYYMLKFILFPLAFRSGVAALLFIILTICVPVVAHRLTKHCRQYAYGGVMNVGQVWSFLLWLFFFASLLVAAEHYVYFAYIDHGRLAESYATALATYDQLMSSMGMVPDAETSDMLHQSCDMLAAMRPIEMVMNMFVNNLFWGCILTLPLTVINAKAPKPNE